MLLGLTLAGCSARQSPDLMVTNAVPVDGTDLDGANAYWGQRYQANGEDREAVLNVSYARRNGIKVGETIKLKDKTFTVVGLARSPLGGQSSDAYVKLAQLQALSDRKGRVNSAQVRAWWPGAAGRARSPGIC